MNPVRLIPALLLLIFPAFSATQEVLPAAPGVTVTTDRPLYLLGEPIRFTVRNDSDAPFWIYSASWWNRYRSIYDLLQGVSGTIPAHQSRTFAFRRQDDRTMPVGHWRIVLTSSRTWVETSFHIVPRAAEGVIFRTTQPRYSRNMPVQFYVLNRSRFPQTLSNGAPWSIRSGAHTVFAPMATMALVPLAPREGRRMWSWDQRGTGGPLAPFGRYEVRLRIGIGASSRILTRAFRLSRTAPDAR